MKTSATLSAATCALAAAATVTVWKAKHALPEGIAGGATAILNGQLFYAGGTTWRSGVKVWLSTVQRYDPALDTWSPGPELPEGLAYGPAVEPGGALEILGGMNGTGPVHHIWRLTPGAHRWEPGGTLPFPTALARAALLGDRTYIFGGCPDVASLADCSNAVMVRDRKGTWSSAGTLPAGPIALAATAVIENQVYLFGGCAPTGPTTLRNLDGAWRFDPAAHAWHPLRPIPHALRSLSAVVLDNGRILLAGGYGEQGFSASVWIYHPDRDAYEAAVPLPAPVAGLELVRSGSKLYGMGGEDRPKSRSAALIESQIEPQIP